MLVVGIIYRFYPHSRSHKSLFNIIRDSIGSTSSLSGLIVWERQSTRMLLNMNLELINYIWGHKLQDSVYPMSKSVCDELELVFIISTSIQWDQLLFRIIDLLFLLKLELYCGPSHLVFSQSALVRKQWLTPEHLLSTPKSEVICWLQQWK